MATLIELTTAVRILCGSPGTTEVPDSIIQAHLSNFTLRWFNKRRPKYTLSSFVTVADQQDYSIPAAAYTVINVYWMSSEYEIFSPGVYPTYWPNDYLAEGLAGYSTINNPALVEARLKLSNENRKYFGGDGYVIPGRVIRLVPTPGTSGNTVYFEYTGAQWTAITDDSLITAYQDAVEKYAASGVLRGTMAIKRGFVRGGRNFSGGGGANEIKLGDEYLVEAEGMVPVSLTTLARG